MNTLGTGKNANIDGKEGTEKGKPLIAGSAHKKATKASQIKTSQNKGDKANKGNLDTLLGDPMVNAKKGTSKTKEKRQKDTIGTNDIEIFEFIFQGLPNPPLELQMLYKSNCTKEMKKEKEMLPKEFKSLRKHLIL